jgi:AraC-like DNA-binding protein
VPLIIGFEAPLRHAGRHIATVEHQSFVAGLQEAPVISQNRGLSAGLQVNLTPVGAYLLFRRPMHEIANNVASIDDMLGAAGPLLVEALHDAGTWEQRFSMLDAVIADRLARAHSPSPVVAWAIDTMEAAGGNVSIAGLADRAGWSRKHLVTKFREQIGLPPKTFARIARFSRAMRIVRSGQDLRWIDVAQVCGYYDQAHFIRDFSEFAGVSPTRFLESRPPWGAVLAGAEREMAVTSVQD